MGPYFNGFFKSFIDTSIHQSSSLILYGEFVQVFFPPPLEDLDFGVYCIEPHVAYADSIIVDSDRIILEIQALSNGNATIIVDGVPPAVISIQVSGRTFLKNIISNSPRVPRLRQNYPNPFNPETTIQFSLLKEDFVLLDIYNVSGEKIITLKNNVIAAGHHSVTWNGRDRSSEQFPSGIYICKLRTSSFQKTITMLLLK